MAYSDLDELMSGRSLFTGTQIDRTANGSVLAIDRYEIWGAAVISLIGKNGDWSITTIDLEQTPDGVWQHWGQNTVSGTSVEAGRPRPSGDDGRHLEFLPCGSWRGSRLRGSAIEVSVTAGIASTQVASIRIRDDHDERSIGIGAAGAFVAITAGPGTPALTPLGPDGVRLDSQSA